MLLGFALLLLSLSHATKDKEKAKKKVPGEPVIIAENDITPIDPRSITIATWAEHTLDVLQLMCSTLNLQARGDAQDLARRIYTHYNPPACLGETSRVPSAVSLVSTNAGPIRHSEPNINIRTQPYIRSPPAAVNSQPIDLDLRETIRNEIANALSSLRDIPPTSVQANPFGNLVQPQHEDLSTVGLEGNRRSSAAAANHRQSDIEDPFSGYSHNEQDRSCLPAVTEKLLHKIRDGKFVDFDLLFPQAVPPSANDDYTLEISGDHDTDRSISLIPKSHTSKAKVVDFSSWLAAWCTFMRVYLFFYSHLTQALLSYMSTMVQYGKRYVFHQFSLYDRQFRMCMKKQS